MSKKYPYHFSGEELRRGCRRCIDNVKGLLDGAKILNDNMITQQYALGLYMYAVEEYGKAILLKNAIVGNKNKYEIDGWVLGFGNPDPDPMTGNKINAHDEKLRIGFDNLPSRCRIILRGVKVTESSPSTRTVTVKKGKYGINNKVSVAGLTTGTFYDTTNFAFDYNLDLKTSCFYMDWDQSNSSWKYDVATQQKDLKKNIECLEKALTKGMWYKQRSNYKNDLSYLIPF